MSERILLLRGSFWADGNSRDLAEHFIAGAESVGKTVVVPELDRMNISDCLSCNQCRNGQDGCYISDDDMRIIYDEIEKCEAIVIITPMMYFGMPGQLKAIIDRFYCLGPQYPVKKFAEVYTAKRQGTLAFLPVVGFHEFFTHHMGWEDMGCMTEGGLTEKHQVQSRPLYQQVYELAQRI